jgi:hypothetical protein
MTVAAIAPDGSPVFRGRLPDAPPSTGTAPSGGAVTFETTPGKVQLRLTVEGSTAEVLDSETREISIPDLTALDLTIATPIVFRARTIREFQQMKVDPKATPTAAREFGRSERVFLRVATYGGGSAAPSITARLLNRAGQAITDLPVASSAGVTGTSEIELALATLAPGEYVVELTAAAAAGQAKELVGFRITG